MAKYQAYPEYKDSGVEWIGKVPNNWKVFKLNHFAPIITCGVAATPEYVNDGIAFLSAQNIKNQKIDLSKGHKFISENSHKILTKNRSPRNGDILLSRVGTVGEVCIVDVDFAFSIFVSLTHLRLNQEICKNSFFVYLCQSQYVKSLHSSVTLVGGGVGNLNVNDLREYKLPIPPQSEQVVIANFLDHETAKIDTLIDKQQQLIQLLKEKRQAVISHAVTKGLNPNAPMRDSGVEWLGEVPEHWEVLSLSFALKLQSGDTITADSIEETGDYLVYGGNGVRGYTSNYNCDGEFVLIGRQGALCGNINMASGQFFASEHAIVVYPRKSFNNTYLAEMLRYMDLGQYSVSAAQPGVSVERLNLLKVIMPPENEQVEISKVIVRENLIFESLTNKCVSMIRLLLERRTALISAAVTGKIDIRD